MFNQDFFYVCPAHLQDRHFCSPIVDTEGDAARLKEEAMAKEIEKVKKEYEEKQQRKKEREKSSKDDKDEKNVEKEKNDEGSKDKDKDSKANDEKERDDKVRLNECSILLHVLTVLLQIKSIQKGGTEPKSDNSPRIFALHKYVFLVRLLFLVTHKNRTFYQMRIDRLKGIEMAKRNQERMKNPSLFPSVPNRDL